MDAISRCEGGQSPEPTSILNIELVRSWEQRYSVADGCLCGPESEVIREVESDKLNYEQIEKRVQNLVAETGPIQSFCSKCRHLLDHWPDLETKDWACAVGRPCHTVEIEAAARAGCTFCAFLLSRLKVTKQLDSFRRIEARLETVNNGGTASLSIQNWGRPRDTQLLWLNFPGKVATHCNDAGATETKFQSHILFPPSKLWEEHGDALDMAKLWLDECSESHEVCGRTKTFGRPTRLISISNDVVKLVLLKDWHMLPPYATLSYCWGSKPFPMLTMDSLESFRENIPIEGLPQTFQDAIQVARRLGLGYIWIDALCIIQRDNSDWLHESGQMRSVYGGAYINLAASSATSVYEGFSFKPTQYNGGFCARVTTSEYCMVRNFYSSSVYKESSSETYLATRAWTFQEKLLAPRTLSLGAQGVFWECRREIKSEFLPDGFPGLLGSQLVGPEDQAWGWFDIVWNYSAANLTHGSDKLPAISGIAARQYAITGDQYLAGMWRKRFAKQLPWMVNLDDPRQKKKRPEWRAPTWSWVSVDSRVAYWAYWDSDSVTSELKDYIRVLDVWTAPTGSDPFGPVSGGELSVACSALVCGYLTEPVDSETALALEAQGNESVLIESNMQPFAVVMDCIEDGPVQSNAPVYLLPIFGGPSGVMYQEPREDRGADSNKKSGMYPDTDGSEDREDGWVEELLIRGIVLQKSGNGKGHFHRTGAFDLRSPNPLTNERDPYKEFIQILERAGQGMAEAECAEILGVDDDKEARYAIVIE